MDSDTVLVIGLALAWLGVPAFVAAYAHRRNPYRAMTMLVMAGGCIAWATLSQPGGYQFSELPDVVFRVLGQLL